MRNVASLEQIEGVTVDINPTPERRQQYYSLGVPTLTLYNQSVNDVVVACLKYGCSLAVYDDDLIWCCYSEASE